jgi:hypothetical protein
VNEIAIQFEIIEIFFHITGGTVLTKHKSFTQILDEHNDEDSDDKDDDGVDAEEANR